MEREALCDLRRLASAPRPRLHFFVFFFLREYTSEERVLYNSRFENFIRHVLVLDVQRNDESGEACERPCKRQKGA